MLNYLIYCIHISHTHLHTYRSCFFRPCSWHGVWWLLLLLYTPLLHNSISILNCPIISAHDNEDPLPRWQINGNIKCFNGTHIPLTIVALFVLIFCVALLPITVLISLKKIKRPRWIRFLQEPLMCAYKDKYKWWSVIELGKRIVLVLFAIVLPNNDYAVIMTLMVIIAVSSYCKPYKSLLVNVLDLVLACDILIMLMLRNTTYLTEQYQVFLDSEEDTRRSLNSELCIDRFTAITDMATILVPFYYLPLAVGVTVFVCWVIYSVYCLLVQMKCSQTTTKKASFKKQLSTRYEMKPRTRTVVDLKDLDPQSPEIKTEEQFKPEFELLSIDKKQDECTSDEVAVTEHHAQTTTV